MPDDRELEDTRASVGDLRPVPGLAAMDELVVSRQSETLEPDDVLDKKPLGMLFWLALGWVGLIIFLAVIANLSISIVARFAENLAIDDNDGVRSQNRFVGLLTEDRQRFLTRQTFRAFTRVSLPAAVHERWVGTP